MEVTTYVGIDAHKKDLFLAKLIGEERTPVMWKIPNDPQAVRRVVRALEREAPGPVVVCYEAGPCGYALQRQMTTPRVRCQVIAPALIPRKPGEHVKTNRRDARKLAELLRAGLLTEVQPPTLAEEAVRDLCRAREDAREDLQRCRHRLSNLLLASRSAFQRSPLDTGPSAMDRQSHVVAGRRADGRRRVCARAGSRRGAPGRPQCPLNMRWPPAEPYREPVSWLRCFRGIDTVHRHYAARGVARLPSLPGAARVNGLCRTGPQRRLLR